MRMHRSCFVPVGHIAGIVWRCVDASVSYQGFLGIKTPYIADLSDELRTESRPYTEHLHDDWIFRELRSK